jgi:shikimate dehydrogenase
MTMTFHLGLTGYPLDHSLSPRLHAAALKGLGLTGEYNLYPVAPADKDGLASLLERLRSGDLHGLNVTIPHKQAVIPLLDDLTPVAQVIGAVNTLFRRDGRLIGENTDAQAFLTDLNRFRALTPPPRPEGDGMEALVLGAGGAARAVIFALANAGWNITAAARRLEQVRALVSHFQTLFPAHRITPIEYKKTAFQSLFPALSLIVNTTPVGMFPKTEFSPWPEGLSLPRAAVYDLVYTPGGTRFVRQARLAGLHATTGLWMLVEQAALAFEIWTGCTPPRAAMYAAVEEK